jgi:hypothetical protein
MGSKLTDKHHPLIAACTTCQIAAQPTETREVGRRLKVRRLHRFAIECDHHQQGQAHAAYASKYRFHDGAMIGSRPVNMPQCSNSPA